MKILHTVEYYFPSIGGVQEVVKQLSENLVERGHEVHVATTKLPTREGWKINGVHIIEFDIKGNYVRGYTGNVAAYQNFILRNDFDIITNFAALRWPSDLTFPLLEKINAVKIFVPTGFSKLFNPSYHSYFLQMKTWMKNYDLNIFLSRHYRDIDYAKKNGIRNYAVIPNGASEREFKSPPRVNVKKILKVPNSCKVILLVGSHTGFKGHREAMAIFSRAKMKDYSLIIIGRQEKGGCYRECLAKAKLFNLSQLFHNDNKKIIVTSLPREQTVNLFKQAAIFLFPSNIECSPLVLFEACASKTPFLATDVGNSREIVSWTKGGKLLPTVIDKQGLSHAQITTSARQLEDLAQNSKLRRSQAQQGFKNWRTKFTWEKIAARYEGLYLGLLQKR